MLENFIAEMLALVRDKINELVPAVEAADSLAKDVSQSVVSPVAAMLNELLPAIGGIGGTAVKELNPAIIALIEFLLNEFVDISEGAEEAQGRLFNERARLRKKQLSSYMNTGGFTRSEALALVLAGMGSSSVLSAGQSMQGANQALNSMGSMAKNSRRSPRKG